MITIDTWEAAVGFAAPFLIGLVLQAQWALWKKITIAVVSSAVVGTVTAYLAGGLTSPGSWLAAVVTVFTLSQAFYHTFWKPTGLAAKLEAVPVWPLLASLWNAVTRRSLPASPPPPPPDLRE